MSGVHDVDNLKFPLYSGWVKFKDSILTSTRYWMVLCNGKLFRYKDWRQNFHDFDNVIHVRKDNLLATRSWNRWVNVGDISFQAEDDIQCQQWYHCLQTVLEVPSDVKYSIDQFQQLVERKKEKEDHGEIRQRLVGIMTISKDATTDKLENERLAHYLKDLGYVALLCNLYTRELEKENITTVSDETIQEASVSDDVSDGVMIIYILRRLIWRLAYASSRFSLEVTRFDFVRQITKDARSLLDTKESNWMDGNYLLYYTLDCIQQFAKSPCKRDVFYEAGTYDFLVYLRSKDITNKVKMASLLTMSHIVKENDIENLSVDEDFMKYFMSICTKSVENTAHNARICNRTPYIIEVSEIFDALCKICRLEQVRNIVLQKNIAFHLRRVSEGDDMNEIRLALRLIEMIGNSPAGRKLFQDETDTAIIFRVKELRNSKDKEVSLLAEKVTELLKKREPRYVRKLGPESELLYWDAIKEGSVNERSMRVFIVGHASAGKTTLLKRLMADNIVGIESTEGIDIYAQKFVVDLKTGKWNIKLYDDQEDAPGNKMASAIKRWESNRKDKSRKLEEFFPSNSEAKGEEDKHKDIKEETRKDFYENDIPKRQSQRNKRMEEIFGIESILDLPKDFAFVTIYDFAGGDIYYATHHTYLSPYAVYVIVLDLSESNADLESMKEKARFWFRSILTYGTLRENDGMLTCPPVIFVGTHKDRVLVGESDEVKGEYARKQFHSVIDVPAMVGMNKDFIIGTFFVDNTDANDSTFQSIKEAIVDGAKQQKYWNDEVPIKWIACEREAYFLRKKNECLVSVQSFKDHLQEIGLTFCHEEEFFEIVRYLHHMGHVIFPQFCSDAIKDMILIDPHRLVNVFKRLVGHVLSLPENESHKILLNHQAKMKEAYTRDQVQKLCGSEQEASLLIAFMEELNLFARIREDETILLPGLLKEQNLTLFHENSFPMNDISKSSTLCFVFGDNFIPDILFDKLIAACVSKWNVLHLNGRHLIKKRKGVFQLEGQWNLMLVCHDSAVQMLLYKFIDGTESIPCDLGKEVRLHVKKTIEKILQTSLQNNIHPQEYIQCQILESEMATWVKVSDLFKYQRMRCCIGRDSGPHTLTSDHLRHWYPMIADTRTTHDAVIFKDVEDAFHTPPESPTFPRKFDIGESDVHKFKRSYDATFTLDQVRSLVNCLDSIGQLVCPSLVGTCFRVGSMYLMTSYHLVKEIISEGPPGTPMVILENLCHNNVFIIFQQHHKLRLRPVIPFFDEELDVAILVLQEPESRKDVPPPLKLSFEPPVKGQTFTLSGFGHPIHNKQVLEFNVKILDVYSSRVVEAKKWVEHNSQVIANTLLYNGKVHCAQDIERSYHPIDRTHNVAIDCFMEKGASGAPGICFPSDKLNPEVSFMVSGGLPIFFWNLHEIHMGHIPPEIRMEYAVTMSAVREKMLYNNMVNLYNECFFPETFMSLNQGADHEISDALRRLTS